MAYHSPILLNSSQIEEFKKDWDRGVPCKTMANKYGFANAGCVSRKATNLNLSPRGVHKTRGLFNGTWQLSNRGIKIWVPKT